MKEKLTWRHLLARSFSRTPETLQKVLKGIVKKETNKDKRVQLYNTVRWSSDNLHTVRRISPNAHTKITNHPKQLTMTTELNFLHRTIYSALDNN